MQSVLFNASVATLDTSASGQSYGLVEDGALAVENERIVWVGAHRELPERFSSWESRDLGGRLVTPGLVDCHTHLVYGGSRAREFEQRLEGASYEEISRAGGGIVSTVTATRDASFDELVALALPRLDALIREGVTTIEIKSGYGLDIENELKMLRVARALPAHRPVRVVTSFLGAHALPKSHASDPDGYIDEVCIPGLRAACAEGLVDAVDGFCEGIAFNTAQIGRVFDAAVELGVPVKLHAEQLSNIGGTALAAKYNALSADHLEYATDADVAAMAQGGTAAVLLPGAFYFLSETQLPPVDSFRKHGVAMALASDSNPGSSPLTSVLLAMNMACTQFRMTPLEALVGVTRAGAGALGLKDCGIIRAGLRADLAVWDVTHPAELAYRIGFNPIHQRIFQGQSYSVDVALRADG